jgi:hypothetical protein
MIQLDYYLLMPNNEALWGNNSIFDIFYRDAGARNTCAAQD